MNARFDVVSSATPEKIFLWFLLLFLTPSLSSAQQASKDRRPNVLFIMCDDLNDYQGVFGGHRQAKTPHIDALAKSGVQFMNAQTNVPVCQPSRNCLFTGVYPHASKDFGWTKREKQPIVKHNKTLMALLQENGYYTLGSGKLLHTHEPEVWDEWGMNPAHNYGPLVSNGSTPVAHPAVPEPYSEIGPIDGSFGRLSEAAPNWVYGRDMKPLRYVDDNHRDLLQDELHAKWAAEKIKELENKNTGQPFFMGIGFVRPHTPLHAPDKYFDMFPLEELDLDKWLAGDAEDTYMKDNFDPNNKGFRYYRTLLESYNGDREAALKHFLQAYLACVAFVDEQIGTVVDALNNSKFKDNTIVILTSDHGWQMGEKDYLFKNSAWEESARIPLVIRAPGMQAGNKVDQPVSLIDIFPTLVDYCELKGDNRFSEQGENLGGYSLRPFVEDPETRKWEGPDGALTLIGNYGVDIPVEKQNFTYRTKDWRYIRYSDGQEELYDHRKDAYEWKNLAKDKKYEKIRNELRREMNAIIGVHF